MAAVVTHCMASQQPLAERVPGLVIEYYFRLLLIPTGKPADHGVFGIQGSPQGIGQEHGATDDAACAEQCVDGTKAFTGSTGMSAPAQRENARRRPEKARDPVQMLWNSVNMQLVFHQMNFQSSAPATGGGLQTFLKGKGV